jgi:hypothetical protein
MKRHRRRARCLAILAVVSSQEQSRKQELAIQAVGSGFAALIGLAMGGPAGALAGAALTPFGIRWIRLAAAEWTSNSQVVAESAVKASGLEDADEFFRVLEADPGLTALAQRILFAARMSANEQKLRALGGLLGGAVAGRGDHLDEASVLVAVLSDIEAPQVVTLDIICEDPPDADVQRREAAERGDSREPSWLIGQVQPKLPIASELTLACSSDLVRHGLAETASLYGGGFRYRVTPFGRQLAAIMSRAADNLAGTEEGTAPPPG